MTTNNHQLVPILLRCSKSSRWRQPPRVTRTLQPQQSQSATICNHSCKYTWNHSQSHYEDESMMKISGMCLFRLTRMLNISKCQESEPQASQTLFISPDRKSRWLSILIKLGPLDALVILIGRYPSVWCLEYNHVSLCIQCPSSDPNGQVHIGCTDRTQHPTTDRYSERFQNVKTMTEHVRCLVTRHSPTPDPPLVPHTQSHVITTVQWILFIQHLVVCVCSTP